jgi:hypothetical protein
VLASLLIVFQEETPQHAPIAGTSTACPLTAGAVAVYRGLYPLAQTSDVTWGILQAATIDVVTMPATLATPNRYQHAVITRLEYGSKMSLDHTVRSHRFLYAAFQCPTLAPPPPPVTVMYTYTSTATVTVTQTVKIAAPTSLPPVNSTTGFSAPTSLPPVNSSAGF